MVFAVLPRPRQIDLAMGGVDVAAEDHRPPLGAQPLAQRQERVVEGQFVRDAAVIAAAVGEVAVDQREIGVVGDDGAALIVELRIAQAEAHRLRRTAREERGAAVALLARRAVPEGVVAGRLAHLGRELLGVAAGLLQAQDVRRGLGQPRQEAGAMGGAGAVDVPGEQGDRRHRPGFYARSPRPSTVSGVASFVVRDVLILPPSSLASPFSFWLVIVIIEHKFVFR